MIPKRDRPCNLCGSEDFRIVYPDELGDDIPLVDYDFRPETRRIFQTVQCRACGLVFVDPMPSLEGVYKDVVDPVYMGSLPQRYRTAEYATEILAGFRPGGSLLDIGCATGVFLDVASKRYSVEGIELSRWAADLASRRHLVHRRPLSALGFKDRFDVITLWGVIEHLDDPRHEMEAVFSALKPGGIVAVYTGDISAWLPRLLGRKWWWFQGMHVIYFSRHTLARMLEEVGFHVVRRVNHRTYFQLFSLAKSLNRYAVGRILAPLLNMPGLREAMVPLSLNGEMLMLARRR